MPVLQVDLFWEEYHNAKRELIEMENEIADEATRN